jgi:hypothetical protein
VTNAKEPSALDHDFHRANIRPSIALVVSTPAKVGESWRYGRVVCSLKDAATQVSTPMRHSIELVKKVEALVTEEDAIVAEEASVSAEVLEGTSKPYGFIIRSDGGSDRNPKNASVQLAMVYAFLKLDADILICQITAADVSHVNEVEGVMPVANVVLQNQAYARQSMGPDFEEIFWPAGTAKKIRATIDKKGFLGLTAWRDSLMPVMKDIESCFKKMSYSGQAVLVLGPADDDDILDAWEEMKKRIDPTLDAKKATWAFVRKNNAAFCSFVDSHILVERYHIEIRKCNDSTSCTVCSKVRMPDSVWNTITSRPRLLPLPTPMHQSKDVEKYKSYDELKNQKTSPIHRPRYQPSPDPSAAAKKIDRDLKEKVPERFQERRNGRTKPNLWHSNNVRAIAVCQNCGKGRCIYAWPMAAGGHVSRIDLLNGVLEEPDFEYICGDALFGLDENPYPHPVAVNNYIVKRALTCGMPIEKNYYSSNKKFEAICTLCGDAEDHLGEDEATTKSDGKRPLPICRTCWDKGSKPITIGIAKKDGAGAVTGKGKRKQGSGHTPQDDQKSLTKKSEQGALLPFMKPKTELKTMTPPPKSPLKAIQNSTQQSLIPTRAFLPTLIYGDIERMKRLFEITNVAGDGNCGYYVFQKYLERHKKEKILSVTDFRMMTAEFLIEHTNELLADKRYFWRNLVGKGGDQSKGPERVQVQANLIYRPGVSYVPQCDSSSWLAIDYVCPLLAHKYMMNGVVYLDVPLDKNHTFTWTDQDVVRTESDVGDLQLPDPAVDDTTNTLYMAFINGNHFLHLEPKTKLGENII